MDRLTKEQRKKTMQAIKSSGSRIECMLAKALWSKGFRYRKNTKKIIGKPDISNKKYKIAIFVDSEFWHGYEWDRRKNDFKTNKKFRIDKIERNIKRDKYVTEILQSEGWTVLRFWGDEIKKNVDLCCNLVIAQISGK